MDASQIIAGFIISTVGFSLFLFGKKQQRTPHLVTGILMMAAPIMLPGAVWVAGAGALLLVGLRVGVRYES